MSNPLWWRTAVVAAKEMNEWLLFMGTMFANQKLAELGKRDKERSLKNKKRFRSMKLKKLTAV